MWVCRFVVTAAGADRFAAGVVLCLDRDILRSLVSMIDFVASAKKFVTSEDAPTMVEYGLLVALIAIVVAAAAALLGGNISTLFTAVGTSV
jgi:pilus assembly protein Flp/PilA